MVTILFVAKVTKYFLIICQESCFLYFKEKKTLYSPLKGTFSVFLKFYQGHVYLF